VEIVVEGCPQFIFDVMKMDYYPSEKLIRTAMSLAFPEMITESATMAKQLKCVLNYMNKKRKARTDGSRMHEMTNNILDWLDKAQQVSDQDRYQGHDCSSIVGNDNLAPPPGWIPGTGSDDPEDDPLLSQLTINSSIRSDDTCPYSDEDSGDCKVQEALEPGKANAKGFAQFWDHGRCTMVRSWPAASAGEPLEELATMKQGNDGFLKACFGEEKPIDTELANVLLTPKPKKKPAKASKRPAAAVLKRPAKASKGLAVKQKAVEEQLVPLAVQQMAVEELFEFPPECLYLTIEECNVQLQNGTRIKLGCFTDQSYITMKPPGEPKWPCLVSCSAKQGARNGKDHHVIMKNIFSQLKVMQEIPSKDVCKAMVLQLLQ
jgi:hypothetical protein